MSCIYKYRSPLGELVMSGDGDALTGLWFSGQKYFGSTLPASYEEKKIPVFEKTQEWLDIYFRGKMPEFTPKLCPAGSEFRKNVWEILLKIPYGSVVTYKDIALKIAQQRGTRTMSAQAVGGAVAHNPISIIIPCHRVVGTNASLTGYAGGIEKKKKLLELEGIDTDGFFAPKTGDI